MVVFLIPMIEGVNADANRQENHSPLKKQIVNDVYAQYRQTGHQYRQHRAMNGAQNGCENAEIVPVQLDWHSRQR